MVGSAPAPQHLLPPVEVAGAMLPERFRVARTARDTADTFTIELERVDGARAGGGAGAPFRFAPGQFNMIYVFGVGEVPISISGDPRGARLVHTTRAVGAVTRAMMAVPAGAMVGIRGPFGSAWPVDAARGRDVLIVAGGIGLAPVRPIVYEVLARRGDFGRVSLLYGARTPADLLYRDEMESWRGAIDVLVTVDAAPPPADGAPRWGGRVGVVTTLLDRATFDPARTSVFTCGPEIMMRFVVRALVSRGVAPADIAVSLERNMKCAVGFCGHCQYGPHFICRDGPVFPYDRVEWLLQLREV